MSRNYGSYWDTAYQVLIICTYAAVTLTLLIILSHVQRNVSEDSPAFNCFAHGNRICAEPASEGQAWQIWDQQGGYQLAASILDQYESSRVEYVGVSVLRPELDNNMVAVHWEDGRWYVFRAMNTD